MVGIEAVKDVSPEERSSTRTDRISIPIGRIAVCEPTEPLTMALERMIQIGSGRALVFDEGRLVGAVTGADLQRILDLAKAGARTVLK